MTSPPQRRVRKTKIVATVGPASRSEETLARLIEAGVDVFRLNFSHGTWEEHGAVIDALRRLSRAKRPVAILQDLQGPRLRTGPLEGGRPVTLKPGQQFTLTVEPIVGNDQKVSVSYPGLPQDVALGNRILLADGLLELEVVQTTPTEVITRVVRGGVLEERKGINVPGVQLAVPPTTEKDLRDLEFGVSKGVDWVALSFVRNAHDVRRAREILRTLGAQTPLIAKIERPEALRNLDGILQEADGIMVARGDLGVELPPEKVPLVQKYLIQRANAAGVLVITATQMLESMVSSPRPTRAEASDVANAILDGTDAVMLSAETAVGQYPVEAVETMARIATEVDYANDRPSAPNGHRENLSHSLSRAAARLAQEVGAEALVVYTRSGYTAQLLSKERPPTPIYAFTTDESVARRLCLWYGVVPLLTPAVQSTDVLIDHLLQELVVRRLVEPGKTVVMVRFSPPTAVRAFNFITVRTVPRPPPRRSGERA
ncbi:MAG: pyruvate kinase [Dehalococcoidia bacterium]|nr:pyruvate kinase [Dehalococcoidia bacterium]